MPKIREVFNPKKGEKFWIDGRSGLPALALVCAIVQSSEEARWVDIEKA